MSVTMRIPAVAFCLAAGAVSHAQQFSVSSPFPGGAVWSNGVALSDVDGDGDQDVVFANGSSYGSGGSQPQHLFLNNGGATFVAVHANLNVANFNAQMVIAEDFDGDGDSDLMFAPEGPYPATTQRPRMLINDGTGVFSDQSLARLPATTMASFCVCAGDVDDDGDLDVVFTNGATFSGVASQALLYLNDGAGFFTNATASNMPVDTYNAQDVTLFDWDGDFDLDIALSGKGAAGKRSRLYLNDGTGHFVVSNGLGTGNTYEIDWADLDGDGDSDGMVQSISGLSEGWARNDGSSVTMFVFPTPNGGDDNEMAGMDYDDDGDTDVFVGSLAASEKVYRNDGGVFVFANGIIQAQSDSTLDLGFADFDGDGDYDMVTAQGESGNFTNKLYTNSGAKDSRAPTILASEVTATPSSSSTVVHCRVRDSLQDDGRCTCIVKAVYATDVGSGEVTAFHMGGGLFRAAIPTGGASALSVSWCATDEFGNAIAPLQYGLKFWPLGNAKLSKPANTVVVSNIGSSGNDGFRVERKGAPGVEFDVLMDPDVMSIGDKITFGFLDDQFNFTTSITDQKIGPTLLQVVADFSDISPPFRTVQAYMNGSLLAQVDHNGPWDAQINTVNFAGKHKDKVTGEDNTRVGIWAPDLGVAVSVTLPNNVTVMANELRFSATNPSASVNPPNNVGWTFAGIPSFTVVGATLLPAWTDQGCALAGVSGPPALVGTGDLSAGSAGSLDLSNAAPSSIGALFLSLSSNPVPLLGGTLKPVPIVLSIFAVTSPSGEVPFSFVVPPGLPSAVEIWAQWVIQDGAAVFGASLSNAVVALTP